jgi:hypothetical protein
MNCCVPIMKRNNLEPGVLYCDKYDNNATDEEAYTSMVQVGVPICVFCCTWLGARELGQDGGFGPSWTCGSSQVIGWAGERIPTIEPSALNPGRELVGKVDCECETCHCLTFKMGLNC